MPEQLPRTERQQHGEHDEYEAVPEQAAQSCSGDLARYGFICHGREACMGSVR